VLYLEKILADSFTKFLFESESISGVSYSYFLADLFGINYLFFQPGVDLSRGLNTLN
jgi:hypothetical protein